MTEDKTAFNPQLVLIAGESSSGKSASLRTIRDQPKWMFLNPEAGKRLPFQHKFEGGGYTITDPYQVFDGLDAMRNHPEKWDGAIIDTVTFLMDMYETKYVIGATNTMQGWANYQQFFKILLQDKIACLGKPVIITAHVKDELDEAKMEMKTTVPIKGALKNNGVEAYFSTVVAAKKVSLKKLENFKSDLLNITEEDEDLGYKHVFQTRLTKETVGERIRSPMGLFTKAQTYMDNDAQLLLDHLKRFYA